MSRNHISRYYITGRKTLPREKLLLDNIASTLAAGVEWVQIREKDLPSRELFDLVSRVLSLPRLADTKILVNTRMDIALAAGASGCHLPENSPPPNFWRKVVPPNFLIGVSCHTVDAVRSAERDGADYAIFAPVFAPLSKTSPLAPRGLNELARAAAAVRIPVFALGGITVENAPQCMAVGAAGVAAITMFQS